MKESLQRIVTWARAHPWLAGGIVLGVILLAWIVYRNSGGGGGGLGDVGIPSGDGADMGAGGGVPTEETPAFDLSDLAGDPVSVVSGDGGGDTYPSYDSDGGYTPASYDTYAPAYDSFGLSGVGDLATYANLDVSGGSGGGHKSTPVTAPIKAISGNIAAKTRAAAPVTTNPQAEKRSFSGRQTKARAVAKGVAASVKKLGGSTSKRGVSATVHTPAKPATVYNPYTPGSSLYNAWQLQRGLPIMQSGALASAAKQSQSLTSVLHGSL